MKSDSEIIKKVLEGERCDYAILVQRYERTVHAAALQILGDYHATQDTAQEAFIIAYEKLASLRDGSAFGAWIVKIARRQAFRWLRKNPASQPLDEGIELSNGNLNGQLDDESKHLLNSIARLPGHERRAVMMKHFGGHTAQSIADMTGHPVGTVTKRLSRAYTRLRGWLKETE